MRSVGTMDSNLREGELTWRQIWRIAGRPRFLERRAVRVGLGLLFAASVAIMAFRHGGPAELHLVRLVMCAYAGAGVLLASRFSWSRFRTYMIGLILLFSLGTGYIESVHGNHLADLALTALATFAPMVFLATLGDVLWTTVLLAAGHWLILWHGPPSAVGFTVAAVVLGGTTMAGGVTAFFLIVYQVVLQESRDWWHRAWEREQSLREFTALAAAPVDLDALLPRFASHFRSASGSGRCLLVLRDEQVGRFEVAAVADATRPEGQGTPAETLDAPTAALLGGLPESAGPIVRKGSVGAGTRRELILPIRIENELGGAVILTSHPVRAVDDEDLLAWQTMAGQIGVAIGRARLLRRLQQALEAKRDLVNMMSHELRTPIHIIIGYLDMLADDGSHDPAITARIRAGALELLRLVESSLMAARLELGKLGLHVEEFSLRQFFEELKESVAALAEARRGVPVRWEIDPELGSAALDRLKLKEILQNLISNGLKYTAEGAVTVSVRCVQEELRIEVVDTGPGIPKEEQERMFEMFERMDAADAAASSGAGLGLYIVKNLVFLMHGSLGLESAPGEGSRFIVALPLRLA